MKLTVLTDNLQKKLSLVNHAVSGRLQLPILSNILFQAKGEKVVISSTDLEIGIEAHVPANIEEEGTAAVPAKLFSELITALPQEKITIFAKNGQMLIESKKTKSTLQTMDNSEFPLLYEEKGVEVFHTQARQFKKDIKTVVFASITESTRPVLSGVLIQQKESGVVFVATDGYRLSLKETINEKLRIKNEQKILIPARVIRETLSFADDEELSMFVTAKNNQVIFSQPEIQIIGRLIDAEFPSYQKIIPTDSSTRVTFDREDLLKAVKTCAIFARESANVVKLALQKEKIVVSAKSPSLGENTVEIDGLLKGEENEIAFNVRYLIDLLGTLENETMVFEMTGPLNPGVFKIQGDNSYLHLIMPIRT